MESDWSSGPSRTAQLYDSVWRNHKAIGRAPLEAQGEEVPEVSLHIEGTEHGAGKNY